MNKLTISSEDFLKSLSLIEMLKAKVRSGSSISEEELDAIKSLFLHASQNNENLKCCSLSLAGVLSTFIAQAELLPAVHAEYTLPNGRHISLDCETEREIYFVKHYERSQNAYVIGHFSYSDGKKFMKGINDIPFGEIFRIVRDDRGWYINNWGPVGLLPYEVDELLMGGGFNYLSIIDIEKFAAIESIYYNMMTELSKIGYDEDYAGNEGTKTILYKLGNKSSEMRFILERSIEKAFRILFSWRSEDEE